MWREMSLRETAFRAALLEVVQYTGPIALDALVSIVPGADHSDRDFALAFGDLTRTKQLVVRSAADGPVVSRGEGR